MSAHSDYVNLPEAAQLLGLKPERARRILTPWRERVPGDERRILRYRRSDVEAIVTARGGPGRQRPGPSRRKGAGTPAPS